MRPTLLIGFAEAHPAPEVLFSLKRAGFSLRAFLRAGSHAPILSVLGIPGAELTPPEKNFARAAEDLRRAASSADGLFALDDAALKLCVGAFGSADGPIAIHATGAQAEFALNKMLQIKAAQGAGIAVPETMIAHRIDELANVTSLPAIVRPAMAVQVVDGRLVKGGTCYLSGPAAAWRSSVPKDLKFPVLVQPLICGTGEGVFGFAGSAGVVQWSGHERVRMMNPHGSGSSACRIKMPEAELLEKVEAMIRTVGWRGPFMVELLRDQVGRPWFMEFNGRMWGSLALARRNGFEYPAWAVEAAGDPTFTPHREEGRRCEEARHLGREILHLLFLARGPKTDFHRQCWPSWQRSILGVLRPQPARAFYNFDPDHPTFFLRDAWETLVSAIRRRP